MSIPDPLSLIQSILVLLDYGNQIAGAGKEIEGYDRAISNTTELVEDIQTKLITLRPFLNAEQKRRISTALKQAQVELAKAKKHFTKVGSNGRQWSKHVGWVFKNK